MLRYDHATEQVRIITVWPEVYGGWGAKDLKYRFRGRIPLCSPHDPNILYGRQRAISLDRRGHELEAISPDLTRQDISKLEPSGPINKDRRGPSTITIFAFAESPHQPGSSGWARTTVCASVSGTAGGPGIM
jgi:hypothetical protein